MIQIDYSKLKKLENPERGIAFKETYYVDDKGRKQGVYQAFYTDGSLLCEEFYVDDFKQGKQTIINANKETEIIFYFDGFRCDDEAEFKALLLKRRIE